ncbi:P27 family predicted phage terminase small subunit [Lysinibacillus parviboronicapiens]|uniref:P27 family predicted phage terminase small subunit n=1 Tax=Lysinibacillus parviboronicapiens TaxID=436516 RepID=A0ABV2PJF1_9BACI
MAVPTVATIKGYLGDTYRPSDDELIQLYVDTHAFYRKLQSELKKSPLMFEHTNKANATNLVKNPLSIELTKTVQTLNNLLKSLGLTPAQRKTLKSGGDDDDGFDSF